MVNLCEWRATLYTVLLTCFTFRKLFYQFLCLVFDVIAELYGLYGYITAQFMECRDCRRHKFAAIENSLLCHNIDLPRCKCNC
jgi:hypothetical protein